MVAKSSTLRRAMAESTLNPLVVATWQSVVKVARAPRPFLRPPDKAQRREHTGSM